MNKPVAVLPDPVSVGQEVWAETEIVNNGCADYKGNIYLGGRGPDGSIQDFVEQPVVISKGGGKVTYKQKRTFSIIGKYTFTMGRVDENGKWQVIANGAATRFSSLVVDNTCRTGYQLSVEQDLTLSPNQAASGQDVTARTVIVNKGCAPYDGTIYLGGRGPGGEPDIQDFPGQKVHIEPNGGQVAYEQKRSFKALGSYTFGMGRWENGWFEIPAGAGKRTAQLTLTTTCQPRPLVVTEAIVAAPKDATAGQGVTVTFTVKNVNPADCAPVTFRNLGAAVRGPGGDADNQDMAYALNIPIPSGQTFVYKNTKVFNAPGPYRVWIAALGEDNVWYPVATTGPENGTTFTVKAAPSTVTPTVRITTTTAPGSEGGGITPTITPTVVTPTPLVVDGTVVPPAEPPKDLPVIPSTVPAGQISKPSANPSFSGSKLTIVGSAGTENATSPGRTWDNNPGTSWATWRWNPPSASFTLDLGQVSTLSGIKWMVLEANQTPQMTIAISTDGVTWTDIGTFGNITATSAWFGMAATGEARYIRFAFKNPTRQFMLGKISEVEVWGTQKAADSQASSGDGSGTDSNAPSAVPEPSFSGGKLAIAGSSGTDNATSSRRAWDGDPGTSWATWTWYPQLAFFTLDLGGPMTISGVKWMVLEAGFSDWLEVSMSVDGQTWVPVGRFGNPPATSAWFGATASGQARFIRFEFHNVAESRMLGKVSEVEVWGAPVAASATPPAASAGAGKTPPSAAKTPAAAAGKTPPATAKTPAVASKATVRPTARTQPTKPAAQGAPAAAKPPTPRTQPVTAAAGKTPTARVQSPTKVPTKAGPTEAAFAGPSNEGSSQPAIQTTGDQANVPTTVVQAAITPSVAPTAPMAVVADAAGPTMPAADAGPTITPIVFDGSQNGPTETPADSGPTDTPPGDVMVPTVTPARDAATDAAAEPATPTPIVFDGSQPEPEAVTPTDEPGIPADGPTVTPAPEVPAADGPTVTPAADLTGDIPSGTGESDTPTPIVFDGSQPEADVPTATPEGGIPAQGDEPTATPTATAETLVPTSATETAADDGGSLYDLPTETAVPGEVPTEIPAPVEGAPAGVTPEPTMDGGDAALATETPVTEEIPAEVSTEEPVPAEIPTEEPTPASTPLSIVTVGDSEGAPDAYIAADFDPNTAWSVWPSQSPREVRLTLDLGQMQPVAALDLDLDGRQLLPRTEVWLSEDGVTWWNVTSFDGRSAPSDTATRVPVGYWTRYIALVVPQADTLGMPEVGGIREIRVWAPVDGDPAPVRSLAEAGMPTTPEPMPTEVPPEDVPPTEVAPMEVPLETAAPVETPADSGGDDPDVIAPDG